VFELQPTLTGRLLTLRPMRPGDFDELYAVASDPLIWELHPDPTRYQHNVFRRFFDEGLACGGALVALDAGNGRIIGTSRYNHYKPEESEIEIGWTFLARAYWGGLYNREMKDLMLRHAFTYVNNVVFFVGLENWRSQRALEKIGATRIASGPNARGRDSAVFRITADRWPGT
jgi:RimJ/RimL family protein N-acetyltransferase